MKSHIDPKNIGSNIRKLIHDSNLTQEEFAEQFGVDPRTTRRWLKEGVSKIDVIIELAEFFNVNEKDILFS